MIALPEIVNKVDQSSRHYSAHSIVIYIKLQMISANCKTKLPQFKVQPIEGRPLGTSVQVKIWKIVNATCAVQDIPCVVQSAICTLPRPIYRFYPA
jgi:hypothetical protein